MDPQHQNILQQLRRSILDDVDVKNGVLNHLQQRLILTDEHVAKILDGETNENKTEILLDIIPRYLKINKLISLLNVIQDYTNFFSLVIFFFSSLFTCV